MIEKLTKGEAKGKSFKERAEEGRKSFAKGKAEILLRLLGITDETSDKIKKLVELGDKRNAIFMKRLQEARETRIAKEEGQTF